MRASRGFVHRRQAEKRQKASSDNKLLRKWQEQTLPVYLAEISEAFGEPLPQSLAETCSPIPDPTIRIIHLQAAPALHVEKLANFIAKCRSASVLRQALLDDSVRRHLMKIHEDLPAYDAGVVAKSGIGPDHACSPCWAFGACMCKSRGNAVIGRLQDSMQCALKRVFPRDSDKRQLLRDGFIIMHLTCESLVVPGDDASDLFLPSDVSDGPEVDESVAPVRLLDLYLHVGLLYDSPFRATCVPLEKVGEEKHHDVGAVHRIIFSAQRVERAWVQREVVLQLPPAGKVDILFYKLEDTARPLPRYCFNRLSATLLSDDVDTLWSPTKPFGSVGAEDPGDTSEAWGMDHLLLSITYLVINMFMHIVVIAFLNCTLTI